MPTDPAVEMGGQVGAAIGTALGTEIRQRLERSTAEERARSEQRLREERERAERERSAGRDRLCGQLKDAQGACPSGTPVAARANPVGRLDFAVYHANETMVRDALAELERTQSPDLGWCKLRRPLFPSGAVDNDAMARNADAAQRAWFSRCSRRTDLQMKALACGLARIVELGEGLEPSARERLAEWRKELSRLRQSLTKPLSGEEKALKLAAPALSIQSNGTQLTVETSVVRQDATGESSVTIQYAFTRGELREEGQSVIALDASGRPTFAELAPSVVACINSPSNGVSPPADAQRQSLGGLRLK